MTKEQQQAWARTYYQKNREKIIAKSRLYRVTHGCKERVKTRRNTEVEKKKAAARAKGYHIMRLYGLTVEERASMIAAQGGKCAICGDVLDDGKNTHIDHCHTSGEIRGVLCSLCNTGLGRFRDDVNAKNSFGAYTGFKTIYILWNAGTVIDFKADEMASFWCGDKNDALLAVGNRLQ